MLDHFAYHSLKRLCSNQASLTADARTRRVLQEMASEYGRMAKQQEQSELEQSLKGSARR
jgi:hypothetical protein